MQIEFVKPELYRQRHQSDFLEKLQLKYPEWLIVPEGGTSQQGVEGVAELPLANTPNGLADLLCCASASGGTLAGLALRHPQIAVLGIQVVKDPSLAKHIALLCPQSNWQLWFEFTEQRYGKFLPSTLAHCLMLAEHGIATEPIYTGKALHSLLHWIAEGKISGKKRIAFFHTGGLQGLEGLLHKNLISAPDFDTLSSAIKPYDFAVKSAPKAD